MSKSINVEEIMAKHSNNFYLAKDWKSQRPGTLMKAGDVKAIIKEIVEAVIDKCAEEADTVTTDSCSGELYRDSVPSGYDVYESVDKESILKVKQMIDYE